jgi:hypothetical protein
MLCLLLFGSLHCQATILIASIPQTISSQTTMVGLELIQGNKLPLLRIHDACQLL